MSTKLNAIVAQFQKLLDAEYERGKKDMTNALSASIAKAIGNGKTVRQDVGQKIPKVTKKRAPRGAVPALVKQILVDRGQEGATLSEISAAANGQASPAAVRLVLTKGRDQGSFENRDSRWYLKEAA